MTLHQAKIEVMEAVEQYDNGTMTKEQMADSIQRSLFKLAHDTRADGYAEGYQDGADTEDEDEEIEFEAEIDLDEYRDNDDEEEE